MQEITYADFATAARRHGYTKDDLALYARDWWEYCKDRYGVNSYDTPEKYAERVFSPKYATVVIPYLSLLTLYEEWHKPKALDKGKIKEKYCACGCGVRLISAFKTYASTACRKRKHRLKQEGENSHHTHTRDAS